MYNLIVVAPKDPSCPQIQTSLVAGPVGAQPLQWPADCGAEAVFIGRTRHEEHPELGPLRHLEYDVYGPMAQAILRQMAQDAVRTFGCRAVRIVHARGPVSPGEASVAIQVATGHRAEAFAACQYLIDRLKRELPVWKREEYTDGTSRWLGEEPPAHEPSGDAAREGAE